MNCATIREGKDCPFMKKKGCTYLGGTCHPVVEQCEGCNRKEEIAGGWYCATFPEPLAKWKNGNCNMATHVKLVSEKKATKVNPLKASKRGG